MQIKQHPGAKGAPQAAPQPVHAWHTSCPVANLSHQHTRIKNEQACIQFHTHTHTHGTQVLIIHDHAYAHMHSLTLVHKSYGTWGAQLACTHLLLRWVGCGGGGGSAAAAIQQLLVQ